MMRLIDADTLSESIKRGAGTDLQKFFADVCVATAPTVDAVIVTRCKDCKHKGWVQEPCHGKSVDYCKVWDCTLRNLESTFCSYGERKDGEDG